MTSMHPEIVKIKAIKLELINNFTGFYTKPKNIRIAILNLLEKYEKLSTYDVMYSLSPHFYKQDIANALTALEFDRIVKHDVTKDILSLRN